MRSPGYSVDPVRLTIITAVTACAFTLAVVGCGTTHSGQPGQRSPNDCRIYSQDARITVAPADNGACDPALIQNLSLNGAAWRYTTAVPQAGTLSITCDLFKNQYEAVVQDTGEQLTGRDVCQMLTAEGWTGQQQPGPLADELAKQQQAVIKAQASQQAAQKRNQQISGLQQTLRSDISKLTQDRAALENNTSLAADILKMQGELAYEQGEYVTVQHDSCAVRAGDAYITQGDSDIVNSDADTLQSDINSLYANPVSGDLNAVRQVVSELRNLGASPAANPTKALAAANKAVSNSRTAIARTQQQASDLKGTADQVAQEAATLAAQCG